MSTPLLSLTGVALGYGRGAVLEGVDLEVRAGEMVGVLGSNGSGKTTLLRGATGLLPLLAGEVRLGGRSLSRLDRLAVARTAAVVPQEGAPVFPFTVLETVLMGRAPWMRPFQFEGKEDLEIAREALAAVGAERFEERTLGELSGGERQRVVVARALAQRTPLLLADEPTAHLDLRHAVDVFGLLARLARERDLGVLVVTHDLNLAARRADRLALLGEGRLLAQGPPDDVLDPTLLERAFGCPVEVLRDAEGRPLVVADGGAPPPSAGASASR